MQTLLSTTLFGLLSGACAAGLELFKERRHHWPRARGHVGSYSVTSLVAPNITAEPPRWSYHHPEGRFRDVYVGGPLIDDQNNFYLFSISGALKIDNEGNLVWKFTTDAGNADVGSLWGSVLYIFDTNGTAYAINIDSGAEIWRNKVTPDGPGDTAYVENFGGVVVFEADHAPGNGGGRTLRALNATDGGLLWTFEPTTPVWNVMAMFPGDDTLLFQDYDAKVYRLGLFNGSLIWQAGGGAEPLDTWSDGGAMLGPNGIIYAASSKAHVVSHHPLCGGGVHAYRVSDGSLVWERHYVRPFFTWPAVGQLPGREGLSVIVALGSNAYFPWKLVGCLCLFSFAGGSVFWSQIVLAGLFAVRCRRGGFSAWMHTGLRWARNALMASALLAAACTCAYIWSHQVFEADVLALDAETGANQWRFKLPPWPHVSAAGDSEGFFERMIHLKERPMVLPADFNSPTIDGEGKVIIGYHDGRIYSLRDDDSDSMVEGSEVAQFDTGTSFLHTGSAFAPGIFATASTDTLFVWKS